MRVLIAEDEVKVAASLATAISHRGYAVDVCHDGEEAWFRGSTEDYSLVLLDLGLPKLDGLSVLRRWRGENRTHPVIVLSARGTWAERVEGIDAGADDYLSKPFEIAELIARMAAVLRRVDGKANSVLDIADLRIDLRAKSVWLKGAPVNLTPLEFRLLQHLAGNSTRTVSKEELADQIYDHDADRNNNAIEALVSRLRRKLAGDYIMSRRGFGYQLLPPAGGK
jgi:two-component system, OmpR family, response regulator